MDPIGKSALTGAATLLRLLGAGPEARRAQVQQIVDLGLTVYTREGFAHFVSTPLDAFGGLTALRMIELGRVDEVLGTLATDYEGAPM